MHSIIRASFLYFFCAASYAASINPVALSVWVNEAIIASYTYDYKNFLDQQRVIAKYFTSNGWSRYSTAFLASGLPGDVKKNAYYVSAVATNPPEITSLSSNRWQAIMPVLVRYKNPQYQQKQNLQVTIIFTLTPSGQGTRGLGIDAYQTKKLTPAYKCVPIPANMPEQKS